MFKKSAATQIDGMSHLHWAQVTAIILAVWVTVALVGLTALTNPEVRAFEFSFNPYAILSLLALIGHVAVLVLMSRIKTKTDDMLWFSIYIACLALWALSETLTRLSGNPVTTLFWWSLASLPSFLAPAMLFMFALSYTSPRQAKHIWTVISLVLGSFVMMFFDYHTQLFNRYDAARVIGKPWGGIVDSGPYYYIITLWFVVLYVLAIILFTQFYRQTIDIRLKRQARLFLLGSLLPFTIGLVTDGILPAIGVFNLLPTALLLTVVTAVTYGYGILRYRFLALNPLLIATNILDTMDEAVIAIKPNFDIDFVNSGAISMLGYRASEFSHMSFAELLSQRWVSWAPDSLREAFLNSPHSDGHISFDSVDMVTASGKSITTKLSVSRMVEDGQLEGYLMVVTDITALAQTTLIIEKTVEARTREVQETKTKLINSINSLQFEFLMTDTHPEIVMVNTAAHERFCRDSSHMPSECQAITLETVQAGLGKKLNLAKHIANCLKTGHPQTLKDVSLDDKAWRVYLSPMMDGSQALGCVVLLQDTTQEQLLERSRDEFFSIASHELRTPLTAIKGNSSMILDHYRAQLKSPELKEMLRDIHDSSERLIEIVNDFLDASRLEQGRIVLDLESAALAKPVGKVVYEMTSIFKQKNLHLHVAEHITRPGVLPNVIVDVDRLEQILFNLLGNAVKSTDKGGATIAAKVVKGWLKLTVTDTGAGISPAQQPLLFHKFQQAGTSLLTRDTSKGTGLGLYISKLLAEEMQGSLELERSEVGKGSTFSLMLPIETPARLKRLATKPKTVDSTTGLMIDRK